MIAAIFGGLAFVIILLMMFNAVISVIEVRHNEFRKKTEAFFWDNLFRGFINQNDYEIIRVVDLGLVMFDKEHLYNFPARGNRFSYPGGIIITYDDALWAVSNPEIKFADMKKRKEDENNCNWVCADGILAAELRAKEAIIPPLDDNLMKLINIHKEVTEAEAKRKKEEKARKKQ